MKDYLDDFLTIFKTLKEHPKVEVVYYKKAHPLEEDDIMTIQKKLGHALPQDLTKFYSVMNGLELTWRFLPLAKRGGSPIRLHGKIALRPLEEIIQNETSKKRWLLDDLEVEGEAVFLHKEQNEWFVALNTPIGSVPKIAFSEYVNFLTASFGAFNLRQHYLGSHSNIEIPFSELQETCNINQQAIYHYFPQSNLAGANTQNLKTALMQQTAERQTPPSQNELAHIIEKHHEFLSTGGAGGQWKTFHVSGFVFGIYTGASSIQGEQANFEQKRLASSQLDTTGLLLPFTSFCGMYAKYQDLSEADLSYSLLTDVMLEKAIFADANLEYCDFSRANLRGVSFMNANLKGADFENCDLTGADFRGANWKGAKFPGAILDKVVY